MKQRFYWWLTAFVLLWGVAFNVDVMDIDASQYASMCREMAHSDNWLEVKDMGMDYLDKPPLLFWTGAATMLLFGENNVAFKLPSLLLALLAVWSTYRFTRIFHSEKTAQQAALLLASCQAMMLMTNDVKTDTMLMGWVMFAVWMIAEWQVKQHVRYILFSGIAIGLGMLTKGPVALIVPAFAYGAHVLLTRELKQAITWKWVLAIPVIGLVLLPMCIGLYQQFDAYPEKLVNGETGVSGLRFFFWTQSFGRITGESPWNNGAGFGFLMENLLWGLLPWTLLLLGGWVNDVVTWFRQRFRLNANQEAFTSGGFLLSYLSLASSHYQLPHYIYVALPFLAVSGARWMELLSARWGMIYFWLQAFICVGLMVFMIFLMGYIFPNPPFIFWILFGASVITAGILFFRNEWFKAGLVLMMGLTICLSGYIYPHLLTYQAGNTVGREMHRLGVPNGKLGLYRFDGSQRCLNFYAGQETKILSSVNQLSLNDFILCSPEGLNEIQQQWHVEQVFSGEDFHISQLTPAFLMPETRNRVCRKYYVVKILEKTIPTHQ